MNTDKLTEEVSTEDAKKKYKWAIIPIDKLPDDYPVIAIQEFASKGLAEFHLVEEVIVPLFEELPSLPKETDAVEWISMKDNFMPLEKTVLISHKFGIDAIHFQQANWRYLYSGKIVARETLSLVTHFAVPSPPKP